MSKREGNASVAIVDNDTAKGTDTASVSFRKSKIRMNV